jgi:fucose 4-O-acetylase-like acetyltransferase
MKAEAIDRATPVSRDRYVDLLRVISIGVVVLGHWLMAVVTWRAGRAEIGNVLGIVPGMWAATWLLQVMPLFFFVGGFSNAVALTSTERRGGSRTDFVRSRLARLMRPTAIFLGVWLVAGPVVQHLAGAALGTVVRDIARPLWFLGIYLIVVALAPQMLRAHHRHGWRVPVALAGCATVVDVAGLHAGIPFAGYLNFAFVWLFAHQLGFFYADGTLQRLSRRLVAAVAGGALGLLAVLVVTGAYPGSMVGVPGEKISNMNPPTVCLIVLTVWLVALAMVLRDAGRRLAARRRAWAAIVAGNRVIMTVFLWHLTAMLVGASLWHAAGLPEPAGGTAFWHALRPAWFALLAAVLAPMVWFFGRYEHPRRAARRSAVPGVSGATVAGTVFAIVGVLGFAISGFSDFGTPAGRTLIVVPVSPLRNLVALLVAAVLFRVRPLPAHDRRFPVRY